MLLIIFLKSNTQCGLTENCMNEGNNKRGTGRGDWVQLQRGTVATKIKKRIKYLLVVLKKSPLEYHMGKQL
jgi:hypothetical protein